MSISKIGVFVIFLLFSCSLLTIYNLQLAIDYASVGYEEIHIDFFYISALFFSTALISCLMPTKITVPSDYFLVVYVLFVILPYIVLYKIKSEVELTTYAFRSFFLIFPFLVLSTFKKIQIKLNVPSLISLDFVVRILIFICLIGLCLALWNKPSSAGFDFSISYDRRLDGRFVFESGSLLAYLNSAIVNGFAPLLAFYAITKKSFFIGAISFICAVTFYYILGLKATFFYVILSMVVGITVNKKTIFNFSSILLFTIGLIPLSSLVEYLVFDYSLVADYLIRRVYSATIFTISSYFDFIGNFDGKIWFIVDGLNTSDSITFLVGEWFLGVPDANENTNAFLVQFASGGIIGYMLTILLVSYVFFILDAVFLAKHIPGLLLLGFLYGILLTEQAATTALLSSGMGFLIILMILTRAALDSGAQSIEFD